MRIEYPSMELPGLPKVHLDAPDGWRALATPSTELAVVEPDAEEHAFGSNLTVTMSRFAPTHDLAAATSALDAAIDGLDEVEDIGRTTADQHGYPAYIREFVYRDQSAGTLVQHTRVVLISRSSDVVVAHITGSAGADLAEVVLPQIRVSADSFAVDAAL